MIKQPGCLSEKLLECADAPGEFISYSEWDSQASIDKYRKGEAYTEIQKHHAACRAAAPPSSVTT